MTHQNTFLKTLLSSEKSKHETAKKAIALAHKISESEHKPEKPIVLILSNLLSQEKHENTTPDENTSP